MKNMAKEWHQLVKNEWMNEWNCIFKLTGWTDLEIVATLLHVHQNLLRLLSGCASMNEFWPLMEAEGMVHYFQAGPEKSPV